MDTGVLSCDNSAYRKHNYVLHCLYMSKSNSAFSGEFCVSYGTHVLDHLAADGAGLTGGQVTVVTIGQVDAHFLGSLHLELIHGFLSLRNIDLVVVLHNRFSPFCVFPESDRFPGKTTLSFRSHSLAKVRMTMSGVWRKKRKSAPRKKIQLRCKEMSPGKTKEKQFTSPQWARTQPKMGKNNSKIE